MPKYCKFCIDMDSYCIYCCCKKILGPSLNKPDFRKEGGTGNGGLMHLIDGTTEDLIFSMSIFLFLAANKKLEESKCPIVCIIRNNQGVQK